MAEPGPRRTLLIVDDHSGFRAFARALFETQGFDVLGEAVDGAAAVEAVRTLKPDVVLLDIALPDVDGFAVCEQILSDAALGRSGQRLPVVVLTSSRDESAFRTRLERSPARGFIAKQDLAGAVLAALADT